MQRTCAQRPQPNARETSRSALPGRAALRPRPPRARPPAVQLVPRPACARRTPARARSADPATARRPPRREAGPSPASRRGRPDTPSRSSALIRRRPLRPPTTGAPPRAPAAGRGHVGFEHVVRAPASRADPQARERERASLGRTWQTDANSLLAEPVPPRLATPSSCRSPPPPSSAAPLGSRRRERPATGDAPHLPTTSKMSDGAPLFTMPRRPVAKARAQPGKPLTRAGRTVGADPVHERRARESRARHGLKRYGSVSTKPSDP